ncbi:hypothetical protein GGR51DRAFT_503272 [Nemania sp. FL0031]|nr:hypothetical protein GGR51DRAFT_503272 [Nemania sp. FL0031]
MNEAVTDVLLALKPPAQPSIGSSASQKITFHHPAYELQQGILLSFSASDSGGVFHETARIACCLLADCRWDGYLSTKRNKSPSPVDTTRDGILTCSDYFFHVPGDHDYPVVPSFSHFRFPTTLPDSWTATPIGSPTTELVPARDGTCRLTDLPFPNEVLHIVPVSQEKWWQENTMFKHTAQPEKSMYTNCPENALLVAWVLQKTWDDCRITLLPKAGRWVVHVFNSPGLWKDSPKFDSQPLKGVSHAFLLARFALIILDEPSPFLMQHSPVRRNLVLFEDGKRKVCRMTAKEFLEKFGPRTGRSQSRSRRGSSAGKKSGSSGPPPPVGSQSQAGALDRLRWMEEQWQRKLIWNDDRVDGEEPERGRSSPSPRTRSVSSYAPSTDGSSVSVDSRSGGS